MNRGKPLMLHLTNDPAFALKIEKIAFEQGYQHVRSTAGALTLDDVKGYGYDILIVDLDDDYDSGLCLIKQIQEQEIYPNSLFAVSSFEDFNSTAKLFKLGVMAILNKENLDQKRFIAYLDSIKTEGQSLEKLRNMRIAVVDDSRFSLTVIKDYFDRLQVKHVDYYQDSTDFLSTDGHYDVFYIDLVMPKHGGEDLIYLIREKHPEAIIILITTYGEGQLISHCLSIGADDFILKPLNFKLFTMRTLACVAQYFVRKERSEANRQLYELATRDSLTGLYNRVYFVECLSKHLNLARRNQTPLSLFLMDIDHFKEVNDTYGHLTGDAVLENLAALFTASLRDTDVICRWGGEEFIVLLNNTSIDQARRVADKMREGIKTLSVERAKTITGSFGVVESRPEDTLETLIARLDNSLYLAKLTGRDRVIANEELEISQRGKPITIEWAPFFKSGHEEIDREHHQLVLLANDLITSCYGPAETNDFHTLVNRLLEHTVEHFENEERVLRDIHFDGYDDHKDTHEALIERTLQLVSDLEGGALTAVDVASYVVKDVIMGHIVREDFDYYHLF